MKQRILFLDDEGWFAKPYRERLEQDFEVIYFDNAADALEFFKSDDSTQAIVLDIMMPSPAFVSPADTEGGLETGIWWLKEAREYLCARLTPVIVLTNRNRALLDERIDALNIPAGRIEIRLKNETPAFFLPSRVKTLLQRIAGA